MEDGVKHYHQFYLRMIIGFTIVFLLSSIIPSIALAHPPSAMVLEYDFETQKLNVTITHDSSTPNTHYIDKITINKNGKLERTEEYNSQPETSPFSYIYNVQAGNGSNVEVTAECNLFGSINKNITVVGSNWDLEISILTQVSEVSENTEQRFNVTVTSGGEPVQDIDLEATATLGNALFGMRVPNEPFELIYTAPEVTENTLETVNITASGIGYNPEYAELQFTILNTGMPPKESITLTLSPTISSIDENDLQVFDITVSVDDQPLEGVTPIITPEHGTISEFELVSGNKYTFTYSAPDVTQDTQETIEITAKKEGYNDGFSQLQFTILDKDTTITPTFDGVITANEYEFSANFADDDYKLYWRVEGDHIFIALEAKTTGWVAIGFGSIKMAGADMIIGWVDSDGDASVFDSHSGEGRKHPKDTEKGGTEDILDFGGTENNGWTIIEFQRLLKTGDSKDNDIPVKGEIDIIWAMGSDDDFDSSHGRYGAGTINIATGEAEEKEIPILWPYHAFFMILGFIFMLKAILIARFLKKERWWLRAHRCINSVATIFAVLGLLMGIYMVNETTGEHFSVPHTFLGIITIMFVIISPILGVAHQKVKGGGLRIAHRGIGWITLLLMLFTIISGLILVGII